jgi:TRAP-type C4-dicarboxylate transport system permease small subunit
MQLIGRIDRALVKLEEVLLALLLVGMVVLAATQVVLRNIWNTAIPWADISLQNVTVIVGLLGAAIATSEGRHLNIDVFSRLLRGRGRLALRVLIGLFGVVVAGYLAKGGWTTYRANYEPWLLNVPPGWDAGRLLRQELSEGSVPQWLSQLAIAGGFLVITVHFLLRLIRDIAALIRGEDWQPPDQQRAEGDAMLDELVARVADSQPAVRTDKPAEAEPASEEQP